MPALNLRPSLGSVSGEPPEVEALSWFGGRAWRVSVLRRKGGRRAGRRSYLPRLRHACGCGRERGGVARAARGEAGCDRVGLSRSQGVGVSKLRSAMAPGWNDGTVERPQWADQPIEEPARFTDPEALWTSPGTIGLPPMTGPPSSSTSAAGASTNSSVSALTLCARQHWLMPRLTSRKHADWSHWAAPPRDASRILI